MTSPLPDQAPVWDKKYDQKSIDDATSMPFGHAASAFFVPHSKILELGCGLGGDAHYFANEGHEVIATDLSEMAIEHAKQYFIHPSLEFRQLDAAKPLPFNDQSFDVVYSHLALHYYTGSMTKVIFSEIRRILKTNGVLAFACKTIDDPKYGEGTEVEPNMFVRGQHVRHFFTTEYVKELLNNEYDILELKDVQERYTDEPAAMVWCVARKRQ